MRLALHSNPCGDRRGENPFERTLLSLAASSRQRLCIYAAINLRQGWRCRFLVSSFIYFDVLICRIEFITIYCALFGATIHSAFVSDPALSDIHTGGAVLSDPGREGYVTFCQPGTSASKVASAS